MRTFYRALPVALLVLLYAYAAFSKLAGFGDFRGEMLNQSFPHEVAEVLVYLVPSAELLAIALLLYPLTEGYGLWLSLALLAGFSMYIGLVLLGFWDRVPCSCGGILRHMGWGTHLAFNLAFICLNLIAIFQKGKAENLRKE